MSDETREQPGPGEGLAVAPARPKLERPRLYRVLLLNDDYTPMEYVVAVLEEFFRKRREEAVSIMLHVHQKGMGVCGLYPREIAETKVRQVMEHAREHRHPLQCTMEAE
jgi:ATP-dependent Clp protease adaptor protein ClpS